MSDVIIPYRFLVRGGTAAALAALNEIPKARELILETDTGRLKAGDGVTHYNDLDYLGTIANTDALPEGATNLYFTDERAQDALAAAFAAGTHTGITITYNDASNSFSFAVTGGGSSTVDIRDVWLFG